MATNMVPLFTLNLSHRILPKRVTIGKYDGVYPCLTAATASDKIFVHTPHTKTKRRGDRWITNPESSDIALLNINQPVSSIAAGTLKPGAKEDVLIVGTPTTVMAYDVENNSDLFYKEVPDGSNCIIVGHLGTVRTPLALVGGNCSIQGYDHEGNDAFWTVTGDNVSAMALCDYNSDGLNELLVGSEDFDIRVFKEDEIMAEMTETEAIVGLSSLSEDYFAYALANGTIGVYRQGQRAWRIKSKNQAVSIYSYDMDGDGVPELITGWSNGKIDARNIETGEVIFKDTLPHCVAGMTQGDYCQDGQEELIVCSVDGEVRGYLPTSAELRQQMLDAAFEQETVRELSQKKQTLLLELRNYEESLRLGSASSKKGTREEQFGFIPANTQLKTGLAINTGSDNSSPHVEVALQTNNETIVRAAVIFAEGIFDGESLIIHPKESQLSTGVRIPLSPPKDIPVDLHIKAFVGYKTSSHYHVFELTRQLPKFSMYALCSEVEGELPSGCVSFTLSERLQRVVMWINQSFLLMDDLYVENDLKVTFLSLRDSKLLIIEMNLNGEVKIRTDCMDLAGELIQSLAAFLSLEDLQVLADFPKDIENLHNLMSKVEEYQSARLKLSAAMADNSSVIKSLVIRAEDARLMRDYKSMRRWYQELQSFNYELINNYKIRSNHHEELMVYLRQLNQIIQRAGRLRVGRFKSQIIMMCRAAIKTNNLNALVNVICTGES